MNRLRFAAVLLWFTAGMGAQAGSGAHPHAYPGCLQHALELAREFEGDHQRAVFAAGLNVDGTRMAVGIADSSVWSTVAAFDMATGRQLWRAEVGSDPNMIGFSPDGQILAISYASYTICGRPHLELRDARTGAKIDLEDRSDLSSLKNDSVEGLAFSHDGTMVAAQAGGALRVWNVADGKNRFSFAMPFDVYTSDTRPPWVTGLSFSPDDTVIAASTAHEVNLWRARDGKVIRIFHLPQDGFGYGAVEFSPDGKFLAAESYGPIRIWRVADGALAGSLSTGEREYLLGFSKGGKTLLTASDSNQGQVETWDMLHPRRKRPLFALEPSGGSAYLVRSNGHVVMAEGGNWLTASDSVDMELTDQDTGKVFPVLTLPGRAPAPWMNQGEPQSSPPEQRF